MVRPSVVGASTKSGPAAATTSPNKSTQQGNSGADHTTATSTIREIRSRTISSSTTTASSGNARQHHLLGTRRQAASMERLNGGAGSVNTTNATASSSCSSMNNINNLGGGSNGDNNNNSNKDNKCSPINGSSQSINAGSTASSPSRGSSAGSTGGLNRTASRVSRFRSAKAVFERLSSSSHQAHIGASGRPERSASSVTERPRGTVASRYAAAAVARSIAAQQQQQQQQQNALSASPRSRLTSNSSSSSSKSPLRTSLTSSPARHHDMTSSTTSNRQTVATPRPQPRVIVSSNITTAPRRAMPTASQTSAAAEQSPAKTRAAAQKSIAAATTPASQRNSNHSTTMTATAATTTANKPPPRDLIDKIVLEIARDANKEHDANCTIQDLSNCDISGIPETLDFDKCFQDVEMMTEEEARKLLSRKSVSPASSSSSGSGSGSGSTSGSCAILEGDLQQQPIASSDPQQQQRHAQTAQDIAPLRPKQPPSPPPPPVTPKTATSVKLSSSEQEDQVDDCQPAWDNQIDTQSSHVNDDSLVPDTPPSLSAKGGGAGRNSVRFSNEPEILPTWAPAEYDRRNDDIDPVAASAEYEIEKSREREGIRDDDDDSEDEHEEEALESSTKSRDVEAVIESFNSKIAANNQQQILSRPTTGGDFQAATQTLRSALRPAAGPASPERAPNYAADTRTVAATAHSQYAQAGRVPTMTTTGDSYDTGDVENEDDGEEDQAASRREYIESLEREVSLKRIFEQNLRDLQSQYYETVKQLDSYKRSAEFKQTKLEAQLAELNQRYECSQSELTDAREQSSQHEKQLNDIRESSQLLEKKYHRAKRIIKDMQSREESFTRREQLYQQKLDEIEHELGVLISTIDKTIYDDGLKYFSLLTAGGATVADPAAAATVCTNQHQTRLDVFGLLKQMLDNFKQSQQPTQSVQIKQRIVSMLEQQLANLLTLSNGGTSVVSTGPVVPIPPTAPPAGPPQPASSDMTQDRDHTVAKQRNTNSHPYASHRLSQPNMPHPIGVGGQPTKIFHGLGPIVPAASSLHHEPSPPQSVNSYPSTNSLNSLTNNNNNNNNNNNQQTVNNNNLAVKMHDTKTGETNLTSLVGGALQTTSAAIDDNFHPSADLQAQAYQSNDEWHNKPVSEWTTSQVSTWLLALGLDQYISRFEDRNVNGQSLINLDSTVLKGLGVLNSNDRNLLKKKIRELRVEMEKERKIIEKKLKENLKEKSKMQVPAGQAGQKSWKKSLLS